MLDQEFTIEDATVTIETWKDGLHKTTIADCVIVGTDGSRLPVIGSGIYIAEINRRIMHVLNRYSAYLQLGYVRPIPETSSFAAIPRAKKIPLRCALRFSMSLPTIEYFLETDGMKWQGIDLKYDYPIVQFQKLLENGKPRRYSVFPSDSLENNRGDPIHVLSNADLELQDGEWLHVDRMLIFAANRLRDAWKSVEAELIDFELSCYKDDRGVTRISGFANPCAFSLVRKAKHIGKRRYYSRVSPEEVLSNLSLMEELSSNFHLD